MPYKILRKLHILALLAVGLLIFIVTVPVTAQTDLDWDFESGDLSGWTISGQVAPVGVGIDPQTDNAMEQVAHGQQSLKLGDAVPWAEGGDQYSTVERTIIVPAAAGDIVLQFSYAVVANDPPGHPETDKPFFALEVQDLTTKEVLPVGDFSYSSQTAEAWYLGAPPAGQAMLNQGFGQLSGDRWVFIPWRDKTVDLNNRIGHQLHIKFTVRDCNPTAHAAYGYLDNVHLGPVIELPALPALLKTPQQAGVPPQASFLQGAATTLETYGLWPWCLLLPFLIGAMYLLYRMIKARSGFVPADPNMPVGNQAGANSPIRSTADQSGGQQTKIRDNRNKK